MLPMYHRKAFLVYVAAVGLCLPALSAPKPSAKPKPPSQRIVQGTQQLSGDQAVPGREYTLGKQNPMNFQLDSAEYTTSRVIIGKAVYWPAPDEKFLLLHFQFHNPRKAEALVRFDTFSYTAVDSTDTNRDCKRNLGIESTKQDLNMRLKPGQRIAAYTFIAVPANATVPKLIVKASDNLVLRYDLTGKIKPLTGPTADPADQTGATALKSVPSEPGTWYQIGLWDCRIDSFSTSTTPIAGKSLPKGGSYFVANATVRNAAPVEELFRYDTMEIHLTDQDGIDTPWSRWVLRGSSDQDLQARIAPGQEIKVRFVSKVPKGFTPKTFSVQRQGTAQSYLFQVPGAM